MSDQQDDRMGFKCPHCSALLKFQHEQGGKRGPCPECDNIITIPREGMRADLLEESSV